MRPTSKYPDLERAEFSIQVYEMGTGGPSAENCMSGSVRISPVIGPGAGGVHHLAFRVANEETYHAWDAAAERSPYPQQRKKSIATTSRASISAKRIKFSFETGHRWSRIRGRRERCRSWKKSWPCRPFWKADELRSKPISSRCKGSCQLSVTSGQ